MLIINTTRADDEINTDVQMGNRCADDALRAIFPFSTRAGSSTN
jgi:hypothetical protein